MYVGSTSVSTCKREYNRQSKLKQVLLEQYVQVEPAITLSQLGRARRGSWFAATTRMGSLRSALKEAANRR